MVAPTQPRPGGDDGYGEGAGWNWQLDKMNVLTNVNDPFQIKKGSTFGQGLGNYPPGYGMKVTRLILFFVSLSFFYSEITNANVLVAPENFPCLPCSAENAEDTDHPLSHGAHDDEIECNHYDFPLIQEPLVSVASRLAEFYKFIAPRNDWKPPEK